MELVFASHNENKVNEVRKILPNLRTRLNTSEKSLIQTEMEKGVDFGIGYHYRDTSTKTEKDAGFGTYEEMVLQSNNAGTN